MLPSYFLNALTSRELYSIFYEFLKFRAMECGYFTKEQIDDADPTVMIALPRIAIVW
jgi:hypothetical protein